MYQAGMVGIAVLMRIYSTKEGVSLSDVRVAIEASLVK